MPKVNPYPPHSAHAQLWEDWNSAFFTQPIPMQLSVVEGSLRQLLRQLRLLCGQLPESKSKRELTSLIIEIESEINLLEEIGEHALVELVTRAATPQAGQILDESADFPTLSR